MAMASTLQQQSSPLSWVHCNSCNVPMFSTSQSKPKRMMITSCGCIFCIDCSGPATQAGCVSCGAKGIKTLPLGKDLPPHVMELFSNNVNSLVKVGKRQAFKNRQFDKTAQLTIDKDKKEEEKFREEKAADQALDKELDTLRRQLRKAEAENETLDRELMEQRRRGPTTPPNRIFPVTHLNILSPSPIQPRVPSEEGGRQGQRAPAWMGNFTKGKLF